MVAAARPHADPGRTFHDHLREPVRSPVSPEACARLEPALEAESLARPESHRKRPLLCPKQGHRQPPWQMRAGLRSFGSTGAGAQCLLPAAPLPTTPALAARRPRLCCCSPSSTPCSGSSGCCTGPRPHAAEWGQMAAAARKCGRPPHRQAAWRRHTRRGWAVCLSYSEFAAGLDRASSQAESCYSETLFTVAWRSGHEGLLTTCPGH